MSNNFGSATALSGGTIQMLEGPDLASYMHAVDAIIASLGLEPGPGKDLRDAAAGIGAEARDLEEAQTRFHEALGRGGAAQGAYKTGEREVNVATDVRKKYGCCGPRVFDTTKKTLPEFHQTDPDAVYYTATKTEHLDSIKKDGLKTSYGGSGKGSVSAPQNVGQFNSRGHVYFFNSESNARQYGKTNVDGDFAVLHFKLPMTANFTPDPEGGYQSDKLSKAQAMRTTHDIAPEHILGGSAFSREQVGKPTKIEWQKEVERKQEGKDEEADDMERLEIPGAVPIDGKGKEEASEFDEL